MAIVDKGNHSVTPTCAGCGGTHDAPRRRSRSIDRGRLEPRRQQFDKGDRGHLRYAREGATDEECVEAAKRANAHEFIEHLPHGYDTMLVERGANLSQGQRQMITIARAMVADPKIMILDEATSNVDTRTEKLIQDGLRALMESKTSFSIAHRLSTIRDSSRIMVVNGGRIVEMDSHDELMAQKGFYYSLYMSQFKGAAPGGMEAVAMDFEST